MKIRGNICTVKNRERVKLICKKEGISSARCKKLEKRLKKC